MKLLISFLATVLMSISTQALTIMRPELCGHVDSFKANGWTIYDSQQFNEMSSQVLEDFNKNRSQYVPEGEGTLFSAVASKLVRLTAYDKTSTPPALMTGDIVFISTLDGNDLIEVRWYKQGKKQAVYNPYYQTCLSRIIPFADNSLY